MTILCIRQRLRIWLSALLHRPDPPAAVNVADLHRKRAIAEAEYQAAADAQAMVLRVSGKVAPPVRRIPAVVVRERVTQERQKVRL